MSKPSYILTCSLENSIIIILFITSLKLVLRFLYKTVFYNEDQKTMEKEDDIITLLLLLHSKLFY